MAPFSPDSHQIYLIEVDCKGVREHEKKPESPVTIDRDDVIMLELRRGPCFAFKTGSGVFVDGVVHSDHLQRRLAMQSGVLGLVHHAHAAATKLLDDSVMRELIYLTSLRRHQVA